MLKYVCKRLLYCVFVLIGVSIVAFLLMSLAPGSPARLILGDDASDEAVAAYEEELGLNEPLPVQYWIFLKGIVRGDLGDSIYFHRPVLSLIAERLPATGLLAAGAMAVALLISLPLGIIAAVKRGSFVDFISMTFALLGQSISNVWLGLLMILLFSVTLNWLPSMGYGSFKNLIMPAIAMGMAYAAQQTRILRSSMVDVLQEDYITATYARGMSKGATICKYALRNGILPYVTAIGTGVSRLLGGAIVSEQIFNWPGLGILTTSAINMRDFPLVRGILLTTSAIFVVVMLIVDLLYTVIDPRLDFN